MEKVLITGGAGFIGSHTADALIKLGLQVRILDNLDPQVHGSNPNWPSYLNSNVEKIYGDIRIEKDLERALEGVDIIYHMASCTGVGQSMYEIQNYVDVNIRGTAFLLEYLLKKKIKLKRFILSSSRAVYGEGTQRCLEHGEFHPYPRNLQQLEKGLINILCPWCQQISDGVPVREEQVCLPSSIYGWTKLAQEQLCQQMAMSQGFPILILRYFNVFGSRQSLQNPYTGIVSIFTNQLLNQIPVKLYEQGLPIRDFIHVSDLVRAHVAVLSKELRPGLTLNIGSGESITVEHLARLIAKKLPKASLIEKTNYFRVGDIFSCFADIQRAHKILNWSPQLTLSEGYTEFYDWVQSFKHLKIQSDNSTNELSAFGLFKKVI